jgi:ActR/RegA family two-component response regulator
MEEAGEVLVLDDDDDLRDALGDLVHLLSGRSSLGLGSYEALVAARARVLGCELAILDVNLGPGVPSGLDAYEWLRAQHFAGRIVFLTGHAKSHPLVRRACALAHARVLEKPIGIDEVRALLMPPKRSQRDMIIDAG